MIDLPEDESINNIKKFWDQNPELYKKKIEDVLADESLPYKERYKRAVANWYFEEAIQKIIKNLEKEMNGGE